MTLSDKIVDLRQHREAIREAIVAKGGILPLGSHMSDYPGVIEALSGGGELDFSGVNGFVKELEFKDGVIGLKDIGRDTLVLPEVAYKIPNNFLQANKSITTLVNTEYATEIGNNAFSQSAITGEMSFPNVTTIGDSAFYSSALNGDMSFPNVTTLVSTGSYSGNHFGYTKITSIDLPLVEGLSYQTLYACSDIKFINIPNVKTIHYNAFYSIRDCEFITLGETIPVIEGRTKFNSFLEYSYSLNCQFQVPPHMVDAYKADATWSQYADNIVPYPEPTE